MEHDIRMWEKDAEKSKEEIDFLHFELEILSSEISASRKKLAQSASEIKSKCARIISLERVCRDREERSIVVDQELESSQCQIVQLRKECHGKDEYMKNAKEELQLLSKEVAMMR